MSKLKIVAMSEVETEKVDWLWKPYIPYGKITIIQGDGGYGKTTMSLVIAAAVTTGGTLPSCDNNIEPSQVIIQNAEDNAADTIRPRLEQLGANISKIYFRADLIGTANMTSVLMNYLMKKRRAKKTIKLHSLI